MAGNLRPAALLPEATDRVEAWVLVVAIEPCSAGEGGCGGEHLHLYPCEAGEAEEMAASAMQQGVWARVVCKLPPGVAVSMLGVRSA